MVFPDKLVSGMWLRGIFDLKVPERDNSRVISQFENDVKC